MGYIYFVMGKSSSGKDTIYKKLMSDKELGFETLVGYTTRPMRQGEENGKEYFFVSEEEMKNMDADGKVIESRCYHTIYGDWFYFTADDGQVSLDDKDYLLIGTLESYAKVRAYYGEEIVKPIYIEVEDGERLIRAINREKQQDTPKYEEMCRRFLADCKDFSEEKILECGIKKRYINNDIEKCILEIKKDIL
ncbi:MAG: guanylate kinase [Lachnospiraceae bacterium]|nr:guanylate kinase [Lachnospiraceae bacterium]